MAGAATYLTAEFVERRLTVLPNVPDTWNVDRSGHQFQLDLKMCQISALRFNFSWGTEREHIYGQLLPMWTAIKIWTQLWTRYFSGIKEPCPMLRTAKFVCKLSSFETPSHNILNSIKNAKVFRGSIFVKNNFCLITLYFIISWECLKVKCVRFFTKAIIYLTCTCNKLLEHFCS